VLSRIISFPADKGVTAAVVISRESWVGGMVEDKQQTARRGLGHVDREAVSDEQQTARRGLGQVGRKAVSARACGLGKVIRKFWNSDTRS